MHDRVPGDAEYVPAWHMPQLDAATAFENVPAAHKVQPEDPAAANLQEGGTRGQRGGGTHGQGREHAKWDMYV